MEPGKLERAVYLKRAAKIDETVLWQDKRILWAKVKEGKQDTIAPMAVRTPAIELTIRETDISEADAIIFGKENYLITSILRETARPVYLKVTAARSPVYTASVYRPVKSTDLIGATVWKTEKILETVCCLAERYVNSINATGHDLTSSMLIMVTPKETLLREGDSIEVLGERWKVTAAYLMDLYKNQYRIERVKDN